MTLADLQAREAEPWFDPAGFLLAIAQGELIGFHWTKIHPDGMGEIYVLGLDPTAQGTGLAKPLAVAGLASLRKRGAPEVLLYVDDSNTPAMRLYENWGFASIGRMCSSYRNRDARTADTATAGNRCSSPNRY